LTIEALAKLVTKEELPLAVLMASITETRRKPEHGEEPRLRIPRLADLREVVDRHIVDNFAIFYKIEAGEARVNEGTYVAVPSLDQALVLVFHQRARSFIRASKFGEHKHWKYDSFIGTIPDARSTDEEKREFERRVSKVKRSPDYTIPADQINGRVLADIQRLVVQKAG